MAGSVAKDSLKILYLNVNHCYIAAQNALVVATKGNYDVHMVIEPYYPTGTPAIRGQGWEAICGSRSALLIRNNIRHTPLITGHPDIVATITGDTTVVCTYASPNEPIDPVLDALKTFLQSHNPSQVIMGGDFNCRTALIPGYQTNRRGAMFEDLLQTTALNILNTPEPTWQRGNLTGINDYICTRELLCTHTASEDSHLEHHFVHSVADLEPMYKDVVYNTNNGKLSKFIKSLEIAEPHLPTTKEIEGFVGNLTTSLQTLSLIHI